MKNNESIEISTRHSKKAVMDSVISSTEILVFSYLISFPFPYKTIAFIPLIMVAYIISRNISSLRLFQQILSKKTSSLQLGIYCFIGLLLGLAGAMFYRGSLGIPIFPEVIKPFVIIAMSIGIMEELIFRGFIQTQMSQMNSHFAIFFSALVHALYKAFLFLSPTAIPHENLMLFFTVSFAAYIIFGIMRHKSQSLLPTIISHAVFDFIVYAELSHAPWWVW